LYGIFCLIQIFLINNIDFKYILVYIFLFFKFDIIAILVKLKEV